MILMDEMKPDINYLIHKSIKGDKICQEILLESLTPLICKNIYTYYKASDPITEDLIQEGYIEILKSLEDYNSERKVHFLQYIKVRLFYFYKNTYEKNCDFIDSIEDLEAKGKQVGDKNLSPLDIYLLKEEESTLYKWIKRLSEKEQKILFLYYFDHMTMGEISQELNLAYRTVISMKSASIKKLRFLAKHNIKD